MKSLLISAGTVLIGCVALSTVHAGGGDKFKELDKHDLRMWGQAQNVFVGTLTAVQAGPVGRSNPPLYTHRLEFVVESVLRGSTVRKGEKLLIYHQIRQQARPTFPQGKQCVVAVSKVRRMLRSEAVHEATMNMVAKVKLAMSIPAGWTLADNKLVSPWASLGDKAWPESEKGKAPMVCAKTGRPVLFLGEGVSYTVTKVPPKKAIRFRNPDGDGEYKITVKNTTAKPVAVPALLNDGKNILWDESLVLVVQNKAYTIPGANGVSGKVMPTMLQPGQEVSTVVNALRLEGPKWPRGGYRIEFQFCLGERAQTQSFYYYSRHHDDIRTKLSKTAKQ